MGSNPGYLLKSFLFYDLIRGNDNAEIVALKKMWNHIKQIKKSCHIWDFKNMLDWQVIY